MLPNLLSTPTFLTLTCSDPASMECFIFLRHTLAFAIVVWKALPHPQNPMARSLTPFKSVPKCHLLNGDSLNHSYKN